MGNKMLKVVREAVKTHGKENVTLILGDNVFYGSNLNKQLFVKNENETRTLLKRKDRKWRKIS